MKISESRSILGCAVPRVLRARQYGVAILFSAYDAAEKADLSVRVAQELDGTDFVRL